MSPLTVCRSGVKSVRPQAGAGIEPATLYFFVGFAELADFWTARASHFPIRSFRFDTPIIPLGAPAVGVPVVGVLELPLFFVAITVKILLKFLSGGDHRNRNCPCEHQTVAFLWSVCMMGNESTGRCPLYFLPAWS
jgi:hypothetical protein